MLIILTGVPGTGKTSLSLIFKKMKYKVISINEFVKKKRLFKKENGEYIVDIKNLDKKLTYEVKKLAKKNNNILIEGHLACELKKINSLHPDLCIILRRKPLLLKKILEKRKYKERKVKDNLECELIDYCGTKARENLNCPIYELDIDNKAALDKLIKLIKESRKDKIENLKDVYVDWIKYYSRHKDEFEKFINWLVK